MNEDKRMKLDLINETFAELQVKNKELNKPRPSFGFVKTEKNLFFYIHNLRYQSGYKTFSDNVK